MAKGDKITAWIRSGDTLAPFSIEASQNGRRLEMSFEKDGNIAWIVLTEVTRGGTITWQDRFRADEVVLLRSQYKGGTE